MRNIYKKGFISRENLVGKTFKETRRNNIYEIVKIGHVGTVDIFSIADDILMPNVSIYSINILIERGVWLELPKKETEEIIPIQIKYTK